MIFGTVSKISFGKLRMFLKLIVPVTSFDHFHAEIHCAGCYLTWRINIHSILNQCKLQKVLRHIENELVTANNLDVAIKKSKRRHSLDIKIKNGKHFHFHGKYFFFGVCVVSYVDEVLDNRGVNLFILRCDQHGGHSNQLKFLPCNDFFLQIPVNEVDSQVESLWNKLKFEMDFNKPINEYASHLLADVCLTLHEP